MKGGVVPVLNRRFTSVVALMVLVVASCDGGETSDPSSTQVTSPTPTPVVTSEPVPTTRATAPTNAIGVFSFIEHDLCEWMSTDDIADFISAEFDWNGTVEVRKQQPPGENCEWVLRGETLGPPGSLYVVKSETGAYEGLVEYGEQADMGVWVVGHPALDDPALTATSGFGGVAYGFPDDQRIITMWLDVAGNEPDAAFFMAEAGVANRILHELGWFSAESG